MSFAIPTPSDAFAAQSICDAFIQSHTSMLGNVMPSLRANWSRFWNPNASLTQIQAQIDYLWGISVTYGGSSVPFITALLTDAAAVRAFLVARDANAFADAPMELTGVLQPNGQPYQMFVTPGYYYTLVAGKIVVSGPCTWVAQ